MQEQLLRRRVIEICGDAWLHGRQDRIRVFATLLKLTHFALVMKAAQRWKLDESKR